MMLPKNVPGGNVVCELREWEAVEARLKHDLADELSAADLVALNERADPVLADLWDNPKDAAYDKL